MVETVKEKLKWLVVGGDGQLAHAIQAELARAGIEYISLDRERLDVTNDAQVGETLNAIKPDVVFNAAAWTDVDGAEVAEDQAHQINAIGVAVLAGACQKLGSKLVQISTDYVFSGIASTPWRENDALNPFSAYGRTKAEGEQFARAIYPEGSYIVRTAWLYSPWGGNFVKTMIQLAVQDTNTVRVVHDQMGQPTSAFDLAVQIRQMIHLEVPAGIYHGTNSGETTWFDLARSIFTLVGADSERVIPMATLDSPRAAPRPQYSVLGHEQWVEVGMKPMRPWLEALISAMPSLVDVVNVRE
jgi:dTDP-4-dehydrorhamnose reductase